MNLECFILLTIGGTQLIIVLALVVLLFGGKKIPELMRGLGRGVHEFKQGMEDAKKELNTPLDSTDNSAKDKANDQPKAKDVD